MSHFQAPDEEFRLLADEAPVMIWRAGPDRRCDWFNAPWLEFRGRAIEQEIGEGWAEGLHEEDVERRLSTYRACFEKRASFSIDYRLRRRDGTYRWVRERSRPFHRRDRFAGYFGSCFDVTEHIEAEQRLKSVLDERDLLLREVHHRVKNNFQTLMALVRFMRRGADPGGRALLDVLSVRLDAMALVQRYLHAADDLTAMSIARMMRRLLPDMNDAGLAPNLDLTVLNRDFVLSMKACSYLGLAVTEAVMVLGRAGFRDLHLTIGSDDACRHIAVSGAGGDTRAAAADLGMRLARQYAQSAQAVVSLLPKDDGATICMELSSPCEAVTA